MDVTPLTSLITFNYNKIDYVLNMFIESENYFLNYKFEVGFLS